MMQRTCDQMKATDADYWEATDRGTQNLYFTAEVNQLPKFLARLSAQQL
ncbi:MAG: hypothetical protein HC810_03425 [Acaryochloridaceae cyanobacterium RL_2_7]|nr:hypothetical protein [Acaryochloridaceae cyanobacterium RL_2_7]